MRNFLIVLKYTILENARKKAFIITNIFLVLLIILLFNINNIADAFTGSKDVTNDVKKIAIVDDSDIYGISLNNFKIPETNYIFINDEEDNLKDLKDKIAKGELSGIIVIDDSKAVPTFKYIVDNEREALNADIVSMIIKNTYGAITLQQLNVDEQTIVNLNSKISYEIEQLNGEKASITLYILAIVTSILLYFAIYFYGYSVSMSVSNEKTSRVMETLITSTKPSTIVLGKAVAMGLLGLAQLLLLIITALISYKVFVGKEFIIAGELIDFSTLTLPTVSLLILYFILGYALYAMLSAVTGSTVSKAEDLNSASMPVSFISLFSFYLGYFSLTNPTSSVNVFASLMPFSSAFTMPSRMIMMDVPIWEIIWSIVFLIITIVLFAFISVKLYSSAILHYGSTLRLKELFKTLKK